MVKGKLEEVINNLAKFKNLYDTVRVVDPIKKVSFTTIQGETYVLKEETCYSFWERDMSCDRILV
ncbi:MAG: hypothetical protein PWR27_2479 [Petroclostridium sp.]|uniref:hypothetical protein n=1 Tax=Petroclostridium xylanilyticum TaxID=1792311 RepID=UPI000B988D33|nr:hypothetical protein [Petroclostridium xylanilyticum]MBZ4645827.1 hypothetical protein [Clostridia bacterium]MDK2811770.1 hypothetical protein [Petroclostridium sp.]